MHGARGSTDPEEILRSVRSYFYRHRKHALHQRRRSFAEVNRKYSSQPIQIRFVNNVTSIFKNYGIDGTKCQILNNEIFTIHSLSMTKQTFY